jgi:hypothetical protein
VSAIVPFAVLGALGFAPLPRAAGPDAGRPHPTTPALPDTFRRLSC